MQFKAGLKTWHSLTCSTYEALQCPKLTFRLIYRLIEYADIY